MLLLLYGGNYIPGILIICVYLVYQLRMVLTMKRDAINGNVETTDIMVSLRNRDSDILEALGVYQALRYL